MLELPVSTYEKRAEEDKRYEVRYSHVVTAESDISVGSLRVTLFAVHTRQHYQLPVLTCRTPGRKDQ